MSIRDKWTMLHLTVLVAGCGLGGLTTLSQKAQIDEQMQRFQQEGPVPHRNLFHTLDANDDGAIVRDEFIVALEKAPPPPSRRDASSSEEVMPDVNLIADRFFSDADIDKDAKVTLEEFQSLRRPEDRGAPRHRMRGHRMPPSPEAMFDHFDQNHDGYIVRDEMLAGPKDCPPPPSQIATDSNQAPEGPSREAMADSFISDNDSDNDGKVSLEEFKANAPTQPAPPEQR